MFLGVRVAVTDPDERHLRGRLKRQGRYLFWGPIYFQPVLKYYERFFTKYDPPTFEGIKCPTGLFFLFKIKILAFKRIRNYSLPLIQIVDKLITNSETREDNNNRVNQQ